MLGERGGLCMTNSPPPPLEGVCGECWPPGEPGLTPRCDPSM